MKLKYIVIIILSLIIIAISWLYYRQRQHLGQPNNGVYGADRYSSEQKDNCERNTGKKCIFDLCQAMESGVALKCDPGWKPEY